MVADEKPMEVEEEEEEEQKNAGNLLDNLFRKTKTTPCLYWLPLTDEQVRVLTLPTTPTTVEPRYPDLDYPDFSIIRTLFSGPNFCMNINKLSS